MDQSSTHPIHPGPGRTVQGRPDSIRNMGGCCMPVQIPSIDSSGWAPTILWEGLSIPGYNVGAIEL